MKQPKVLGHKARRYMKSSRKGSSVIAYVAGPPVLISKEGARVIASGKVEYGLPSFIQVK